MITLQEFSDYLEGYLDISHFEDVCPNGLQVEGKKEIRKIGLAVSASEEVIDWAIDKEVDALIVHHGLFWKGDAYPIIGSKKRKLQKLLANHLSLFAFHLPLDAHQIVGNNWRAAREMGWNNLLPFGQMNGEPIGVCGQIIPESCEHFVRRLEEYYGHPAHTALGGKEMISNVALVSGGAWKMVKEAAFEGIDAFITGSFDAPAWDIAFEEKIHFVAMGHEATEVVGPKALLDHLVKEFKIEGKWCEVVNPF